MGVEVVQLLIQKIGEGDLYPPILSLLTTYA